MKKPLPQWLDPGRDLNQLTPAGRVAYHYHFRIKQATPPWADTATINRFYRECSRRGLHVDHIVPLRHPLVCGLHVPANLQALTEAQNYAKSNHWWPDCPHECGELFPIEECEQYALPLQM